MFLAFGLPMIWWIAPISAIIGLIVSYQLYSWVKKQDPGTDTQREIAKHVQDGAMAYLARQYKTIAVFFVFGIVLFSVLLAMGMIEHWAVVAAFVTGGVFSALAGYIGMWTATTASNRTATAANKSLNDGLQVAFKGGMVMGLVVVCLALLDNSIWLLILSNLGELKDSPQRVASIMVSCGMGASMMALFARVGGGIFTKAADVGADLVGKVEAGIPEDDPRNPATIADNVGDNVGDVAGMGADLYESYYGSIVAAAGLGATAIYLSDKLPATVADKAEAVIQIATFPAVLAGFGIILSLLCKSLVKTKDGATQADLLKSLHRGVSGASWLIAVVAFVLCYGHRFGLPENFGLGAYLPSGVHVFGSLVVGLLAGIFIGKRTEYYTSAEFQPTKDLARQSDTGAATIIIGGFSLGMRSTAAPVLIVVVGILASYGFCGGFKGEELFGLFGVAISAVGMLSTLGLTLATDAYGPIADNAGGNAEMAGLDPIVRERTDALDALGNTTAATGKGFAIGSAALTALAFVAVFTMSLRSNLSGYSAEKLIKNYSSENSSYAKTVREVAGNEDLKSAIEIIDKKDEKDPEKKTEKQIALSDAINDLSLARTLTNVGVSVLNPFLIAGAFIGAMVVFLFSAMTMEAVGRAAMVMVNEVRRQFKEIAGIMEGETRPDYRRCVDISTEGALKEMKMPALLAFGTPIVVGCLFGVPGVLGLLIGALTSGFLFAVMMSNAGGAWDNAKKYVESGEYKNANGEVCAKGTENHHAAIVGDTVGDPFKDTSGPALNILIKLMSVVSVVFLGVTLEVGPKILAFFS